MNAPINGLRLQIRLRIYKDDLLFGTGIAELMERVEANGSMSAACREMGMAYSKGWKIVRRAENQLGYPLMDGKRGGTGGGQNGFDLAGTRTARPLSGDGDRNKSVGG